jgi:hypothetical protein
MSGKAARSAAWSLGSREACSLNGRMAASSNWAKRRETAMLAAFEATAR